MSDENDQEKHRLEVEKRAQGLALDLIIQRGLYSTVDLKDEIGQAVYSRLVKGRIGTFDCYCTGCEQETPFIGVPVPVNHAGGGLRQGNALSTPPTIFAVRTVCQRDLTAYLYAFQKVGEKVVKIGQFPSMADISFGELKDIGKHLKGVDRKELGTALGLFAHEAASGAFTYLRRVFERLLYRTFESRNTDDEGRSAFSKLHIDQKIEALKGELPELVVQNWKVFSILSKGIHELTDEQCKAIFPLVKAVIFQMLEREEHERRRKQAEQDTSAALQAMLSSGISGLDPDASVG